MKLKYACGNLVRIYCLIELVFFHCFPFQRQSYLQKKELVVKRSLNNIIKGKQKDDGPASRINREKLISLEVDKIQSVTGGNYVNTLLGSYQFLEICELVEFALLRLLRSR